MKPEQAYNSWASQYDTNENKTRDLEAKALRDVLSAISFNTVLEIGCGTGKNTEWFLQKGEQITAVDLSEEMLSKAKEKIQSKNVEFIRYDINNDWNFAGKTFDLVSFSLVLEHIENLDHIFKEVYKKLKDGGYVYIGELHPFKQYTGSKARFQTEEGLQIVQCYNHPISDFIQSAKKYGLKLIDLDEYFDNDDKASIPRILSLLFQKAGSK
jgi:ubiquinone/menaquinone biosynthesis C-methylase UbiE